MLNEDRESSWSDEMRLFGQKQFCHRHVVDTSGKDA
jgi:hypothetical protein